MNNSENNNISLSYKRIDVNGNIKPITKDMLKITRDLRKNQTHAENVLWQKLRNRKLAEFKFLRQHPFGNFIIDFYCFKRKLAIELDGGIHNIPEIQSRDIVRQKFLEENGITVLRFRNEEVLKDILIVLEKILCILND